jgi:DNA-binding transcriptional LysR family regulator
MHFAPALAGFLALYPEIELDLDLSDDFVDLIASRYDVALRITAREAAGLVGHRLVTNRRVLCAAPSYLARMGVPEKLGDLARHRLLAAQGQMPWPLEGPDGPVAYAGVSAVLTNSSEVAREMALGGQGIALRSLWDVAPALASGALVQVLPAWEGSRGRGLSGPSAGAACFRARAGLDRPYARRVCRWSAMGGCCLSKGLRWPASSR